MHGTITYPHNHRFESLCMQILHVPRVFFKRKGANSDPTPSFYLKGIVSIHYTKLGREILFDVYSVKMYTRQQDTTNNTFYYYYVVCPLRLQV